MPLKTWSHSGENPDCAGPAIATHWLEQDLSFGRELSSYI